MSKPRTMSERTRAFLALRGEFFPRAGQKGEVWLQRDTDHTFIPWAPIVVERVSVTGMTVWTRQVLIDGRQGERIKVWQRVRELDDGSPCGKYIGSASVDGDLVLADLKFERAL